MSDREWQAGDAPIPAVDRDFLTHREIAQRLGISRSMVEIIEQRALRKLRRLMGLRGKPLPQWMDPMLRTERKRKRNV